MREERIMFGVSIIVIVMVTLPYIYAFQTADSNHVFGGFLINPIDGHSYLAKMQLGYNDEWKFTLPYTSEKSDGAYLFLAYILLGHITRILNTNLIIVFHLARIFGAAFLLWSVSNFNKVIFSESWQRIDWYIVSTLGAGLGWIAALFGLFTSDFWVAEAYPFLSMYTNPHFSFGLGLMVLVLTPPKRFPIIKNLSLGVCLGLIQPFNVVIVILVLAARTINELVGLTGSLKQRVENSQLLLSLIAFGLGGGIILGYQYIVIQVDPLLAAWNLQNITPTPGLLDLIFSLSPCLILALIGIKDAWGTEGGRMLVYWAAISLCLILVPWSLQRRFLSGIFIPVSGLAILGLDKLLKIKKADVAISSVLLFLLVIPTNLFVIISGVQASNRNDPAIYWDLNLNEALEWINHDTELDSVILADEVTGLYIPSQTGRGVIYGHPFETIEAESQLDFVRDFFGGNFKMDDICEEMFNRNISYILSRMELEAINQEMGKCEFPAVYENSEVVIYKIE
jgi:hypothetical protein